MASRKIPVSLTSLLFPGLMTLLIFVFFYLYPSKAHSKKTENNRPFQQKVYPQQKNFVGVRIIWSGLRTSKNVALTFDDGPSQYTLKLAKILKEHHTQGTFFMLGSQAKIYPQIIKQVLQDGEEIGSHGYAHPHYQNLKEYEIWKDLEQTQEILHDLTGVFPSLFRPPFQYIDAKVLREARDLNLDIIMSSQGSEDIRDYDPRVTAEHIVSVIEEGKIRGGDIILLHQTWKSTVEALPSVLKYLHQKGFQCVTVSKLIFDR